LKFCRRNGAQWLVRAAAVVVLFAVAGCVSGPRAVLLEGEGLGSTWTVKIADAAGALPGDPNLVRVGIQTRVDEVARHLSRWQMDSSVNALNASTAEGWQEIPRGLFEPLKDALALAADTDGAYDPTVAPLVDAWGFGTKGRAYQPPSAEALDVARARVGYSKVALDEASSRVRKASGVQVDLSSMTHGVAADRIAEYLDGLGVRNYLVDVGSEMRARGDSTTGHPWRVGIEQPPPEISEGSEVGALRTRQDGSASRETEGSLRAETLSVALTDAGIATSGNYRYFFDYDGRRYSHRIDPRTGEPVAHALASVTVIAPACAHADALATALTVLGPNEGLEYAKAHSIAALFVLRTEQGLAERMTPEFAKYLN
jgi:FAD:protein FMN transferase